MLVMRLSRGLSKNQPVDAEKARVFAEKAVRHGVRLLMFWGLLFLYGAVQTLRGKFPLERAIPAGAFLLFFIGLFGWALYRAKRSRKPNPLSD